MPHCTESADLKPYSNSRSNFAYGRTQTLIPRTTHWLLRKRFQNLTSEKRTCLGEAERQQSTNFQKLAWPIPKHKSTHKRLFDVEYVLESTQTLVITGYWTSVLLTVCQSMSQTLSCSAATLSKRTNSYSESLPWREARVPVKMTQYVRSGPTKMCAYTNGRKHRQNDCAATFQTALAF